MREILFRGKRTADNQWVEGFYVCLGGKYHYILTGKLDITKGYPDFVHYEVFPETVGQFTGLTDKNGKKIFEGDIIRWDELEWGCEHSEQVTWDYSLLSMRKDDWNEWCEVLGNIHDNPELLDVKYGN